MLMRTAIEHFGVANSDGSSPSYQVRLLFFLPRKPDDSSLIRRITVPCNTVGRGDV